MRSLLNLSKLVNKGGKLPPTCVMFYFYFRLAFISLLCFHHSLRNEFANFSHVQPAQRSKFGLSVSVSSVSSFNILTARTIPLRLQLSSVLRFPTLYSLLLTEVAVRRKCPTGIAVDLRRVSLNISGKSKKILSTLRLLISHEKFHKVVTFQ